jgi:hypothetical protein
LFITVVACDALRVIWVSGPVALSLPHPSPINEMTSPTDVRPKRIIPLSARSLDDILRGMEKGSRAGVDST